MTGLPCNILSICLHLLVLSSFVKFTNLENGFFQDYTCVDGVTMNCLIISNDDKKGPNIPFKYKVIYNSTKDADGKIQKLLLRLSWTKKDGYAAIGISEDQKMGNDAVISCHLDPLNSDKIVSDLSVTKGKSNERILSQSVQNQLTTLWYQHQVDCRLDCEVEIPAKLYLSDQTMASHNADFDLNKKDLYLFLAGGIYRHGELQKHDKWLISKYYTNFSENSVPEFTKQDQSSGESRRETLKAHSLLMAVSWMVSIPIGIFIARFYKETWSKSYFCKRRIWLMGHILCAVIGFICCLVGYILLPIMNGGSLLLVSKLDGVQYHRILGIISISIFLFQSTNNWIQPQSHPWKEILEKMHSFSGMLCYLFGNITILTTPILLESRDEVEWKFMISITAICWICLQLLYVIGISNYLAWTDKHIGIYPWRNLYCPLPMGTNEEAPRPFLRKTILATFIGLSLIIYAIILIYVILSEPEKEDTSDQNQTC